jgi:ankyrin repeat protein
MSSKQALDQSCTKTRRIHPQWPLEFRGTPLAFAICAQSEKAIAALLELGANPLTKIYHSQENGTGDRNNWTAFHLAASLHCPRILSNLIQAAKEWNKNTSISLEECFHEAPLGCTLPFSSKLERYSIHGGKSYQSLLETVQLLTLAGACAVSPTGMTPLMQAIDFEDHDVVSALIECYPSLLRTKFFSRIEPQDWHFPVHFAAQLAGQSDGALGILKLLVERDLPQSQSLSVVDSRGRSPLHLAVTGRSSLAAEWLLQRNPDAVNSRDNHGRFPLHYVSTVENAAKLFAHGAKLSPRDLDGLSPLHYICKRGCKDVVDWFIEHNVTLDTGDLLHSAILGKSYSIVSTLLEQGVPVDETNSEGDTALHMAVRATRVDIVQALLQKNADTTSIDSDRQTPLHLACSMGSPTIVRLILSREEERVTPGVFSAPSFDVRDAKGQTPLHIAARTADTTIGKLLLDHGASGYIQDGGGRTPLHEAATLTNIQCEEATQEAFCRLLLQCRDPLSIRDYSGNLPWHLAWMGGRLELLSLFFSTAYSLAGTQLQCESPGDRAGVKEVIRAAIRLEVTSLVKTLLAQRETLGIQIPRELQTIVRAHVKTALFAVTHFRSCTINLEGALLNLKERRTNGGKLSILNNEILPWKTELAEIRLAESRLAEKMLEFRIGQANLSKPGTGNAELATRLAETRLETKLAETKLDGLRLKAGLVQTRLAKTDFAKFTKTTFRETGLEKLGRKVGLARARVAATRIGEIGGAEMPRLEEIQLKTRLERISKELEKAELLRKANLSEDEPLGSRAEAEVEAKLLKTRIVKAISEIKLAKTGLRNELARAKTRRTETELKTKVRAVEDVTETAPEAELVEKGTRSVPFLLGGPWDNVPVIITTEELEDQIYASPGFAEYLTKSTISMFVIAHNWGDDWDDDWGSNSCYKSVRLPGWVCSLVWEGYGLHEYWKKELVGDVVASAGLCSSYSPPF